MAVRLLNKHPLLQLALGGYTAIYTSSASLIKWKKNAISVHIWIWCNYFIFPRKDHRKGTAMHVDAARHLYTTRGRAAKQTHCNTYLEDGPLQHLSKKFRFFLREHLPRWWWWSAARWRRWTWGRRRRRRRPRHVCYTSQPNVEY